MDYLRKSREQKRRFKSLSFHSAVAFINLPFSKQKPLCWLKAPTFLSSFSCIMTLHKSPGLSQVCATSFVPYTHGNEREKKL